MIQLKACLSLMIGVLACVMLGACQSAPTTSPYARPYPALIARDPKTLDIQVSRDGKNLDFTNTTAREFGPSTVWVNRWFSRPIDGIKVGESVSLPLGEFKDLYSDSFKAGGFFAKENPDVVVMCELETNPESAEAKMYGLVVVKGTYD